MNSKFCDYIFSFHSYSPTPPLPPPIIDYARYPINISTHILAIKCMDRKLLTIDMPYPQNTWVIFAVIILALVYSQKHSVGDH